MPSPSSSSPLVPKPTNGANSRGDSAQSRQFAALKLPSLHTRTKLKPGWNKSCLISQAGLITDDFISRPETVTLQMQMPLRASF